MIKCKCMCKVMQTHVVDDENDESILEDSDGKEIKMMVVFLVRLFICSFIVIILCYSSIFK